jgi:hypothetical protein
MVTSQKILLIILVLLLIIGTALLLTHFVIPEKYSSGEHVISADGLNSATERPEFDKDFTQDIWNKGIKKLDYEQGILLKFPTNGCDSCGGSKGIVPASEKVFILDNGVKVTFGDIMALSGDLFAALYGKDLNEQISDGNDGDINDKNSKVNRFLQAWECMNGGKEMDGEGYKWCTSFGKGKEQVPNLVKNMSEEIKNIAIWSAYADQSKDTGYDPQIEILNIDIGEIGVKYPDGSYHKAPYGGKSMFKGGWASDTYWNADTGGLPDKIVRKLKDFPFIQLITMLKSGRYASLAKYNWDHFGAGGHSAKAYLAGHLLALQTAANGNLDLAYKYDAFACHYLSDMFASGHLRTPRKAVNHGKTSCAPVWNEMLGNYMSKLMHDEENKGGLWVHDRLGNAWMAFGDHEFAYPINKENRIRQLATLQASVDEVYDAYITKQVKDTNLPEYFPVADDCQGACPWPERGKNPKFDKVRDQKDTLSGVGKTFALQPFCFNMKHNDEDCHKALGPQWNYVKKDWNNCVTCERKDAFNREPMFYQDPTENGKLYTRRNTPIPGVNDFNARGLECVNNPLTPVLANFQNSDKIDMPLIEFGHTDPAKKAAITLPNLNFHH